MQDRDDILIFIFRQKRGRVGDGGRRLGERRVSRGNQDPTRVRQRGADAPGGGSLPLYFWLSLFSSRKRERYSEYGETFARWTLSRFDLILLVLRHSAARKSGEAYVAALAEEGQKPKPEYVEFIEELRAKLSPEELEMVAAKE